MSKHRRPKWENPEMIDWDDQIENEWNEDDENWRDNDRICSPLGIGIGIGFIGGYGCYPRRQCYPRFCYPRHNCYPRYNCYPRRQCYPRYCYPR